jgi:uncharacterized protein YbjT (DUF2867 family)
MSTDANRKILVTGATGTQGGAVVKHLLARGYRVRALCRDPGNQAARALTDKGVEVYRGDLDDRASIDAAVAGVDGVFGVQNFWDGFPARKLGAEGELRQGRNLLDAARAAGVQHFVQSTGAGVTIAPELPVNKGKLAVEAHARAIGIPWTILRGCFFMDNFDNPAWGFRDALRAGRLELPFAADTRLQILAAEDLGYFAAMAFERPHDFIGAQVDLAGDELSMTAIAETFTRVTGRPTRFTGSPAGLEAMTQMDEDLGTLFRVEMYERGFRAFIPGLRALYPGLLTLEAYLRRAGWAGS